MGRPLVNDRALPCHLPSTRKARHLSRTWLLGQVGSRDFFSRQEHLSSSSFSHIDSATTSTSTMSSIPNLPESVINIASSGTGGNADAALQASLNAKQFQKTSHIENAAVTNGITEANGIKAAPTWQLHDTPVENQRPLKVIVIGAGYSGVYCGIRIPERLRNVELIIYEKNGGIGESNRKAK